MTNAQYIEYTEEKHEEMLNDLYGDVDICGMKYSAGSALKDVDYIAFRTSLNDAEGDRWECGECNTEYESEEEAEECCKEE